MTADDTTPRAPVFEPTDTVSATPKTAQRDVIEPWFPLHDDDPSIGNGDRWTPCVETPGACPTLSIWFATEQQCEQWITAHLLADPADRDELIHAREVAELAEKDRRTYHQDAIRAEAEVAELRVTVDRVRALINDPEAASLRHHANGDFTWVIEITALNAALDGGAS